MTRKVAETQNRYREAADGWGTGQEGRELGWVGRGIDEPSRGGRSGGRLGEGQHSLLHTVTVIHWGRAGRSPLPLAPHSANVILGRVALFTCQSPVPCVKTPGEATGNDPPKTVLVLAR